MRIPSHLESFEPQAIGAVIEQKGWEAAGFYRIDDCEKQCQEHGRFCKTPDSCQAIYICKVTPVEDPQAAQKSREAQERLARRHALGLDAFEN